MFTDSISVSAMSYDDVARELRLGEEHLQWKAEFQKSAGFLNGIGNWLSSESGVCRDCEFVGFRDEITSAVLRSLQTSCNRPAISRLVAHLHYLIFERKDGWTQTDNELPMLPGHLGELADMFYVFVFLSGLSKAVANHQRRGISTDVTIRTLSDIETRMIEYHTKMGRWGLNIRGWLTEHFNGKMIALGRLQFQPGIYDGAFKIYEHRREKRSIALALADQQFRNDGQFANADDGKAKTSECWRSKLVENADTVTGNAVFPKTGTVSRDLLSLELEDWKAACQVGDPVLVIHIPACGPLERGACCAALDESADFFRIHYPEIPPFCALICSTWLLDPQLAQRVSEESNIVQFQSLFRYLPARRANDSQMYERVFNNEKRPFDKLPADTSLRRALIAHMREGKQWRKGAGYILRSHLPSTDGKSYETKDDINTLEHCT